MPTTVYDIAKHCGLSQPAVSQILNSKGQFSVSAIRRVRQAAEELGYRPNSSARTVRSGRFNAAALVSYGEGPILPEAGVAYGAHDELARRDMQLTLVRLNDGDLDDPDQVPRILRESAADGLLINCAYGVQDQLLELVDRFKIPTIWINRQHNRNCVNTNHYAAALEATEHLLKLGHQRIAWATMDTGRQWEIAERRSGYTKAMQTAGFLPIIHPIVGQGLDQFDESLRLLSAPRHQRPTAVIAYWHETRRLYAAARTLGLRVPEDVSIMALETMVSETDDGRRITAMLAPQIDLGRLAVQMLTERINSRKTGLPARVIPYQFVAGDTCGPVPA